MCITLAGVLWVVMECRAGNGHPHTARQLRHGLWLALVASLVQAAGTVLAAEGAAKFEVPESARFMAAAVSAFIRIVGAVIGYSLLTTALGAGRRCLQPFDSAARWPSWRAAPLSGRAWV